MVFSLFCLTLQRPLHSSAYYKLYKLGDDAIWRLFRAANSNFPC